MAQTDPLINRRRHSVIWAFHHIDRSSTAKYLDTTMSVEGGGWRGIALFIEGCICPRGHYSAVFNWLDKGNGSEIVNAPGSDPADVKGMVNPCGAND